MIVERIDNIIQLAATGLCTVIALRKAYITRKHAWVILALSSFVYFLGDLYWQLFLRYYGHSPKYSYISDVSWYASMLFMWLLLIEFRADRKNRSRSIVMWLVPAFTVGMCIFFMQGGEYISNTVAAVLMYLLMGESVDGLLAIRKYHEEGMIRARALYINVLAYCFITYGMWAASVHWAGDSVLNPYFWADTLISVCFLIRLNRFIHPRNHG